MLIGLGSYMPRYVRTDDLKPCCYETGPCIHRVECEVEE